MDYETIVVKKGERKKITKRAERVFAYELYHQFRKLMGDESPFYLNGEIWKDNTVFESEKVASCYPDLVYHGSLGCINLDTQFFICEIKMADNPQLLNDFIKLTQLSSTKLNFKHYVFLCVGLSKKQLVSKILGRRKRKPKEEYNDKIICICRYEDNTEMFRLKDMIL